MLDHLKNSHNIGISAHLATMSYLPEEFAVADACNQTSFVNHIMLHSASLS